jgi:hypothetical protein
VAKPEGRLWTGEQAALDLEGIVSTPAGRRVFYRLIHACGVFDPMTTVNGMMQWQEGRRDVGLALLRELDAVNPNVFPLMMQEYRNAELPNGK